jgi:predicted small metal-binding protein
MALGTQRILRASCGPRTTSNPAHDCAKLRPDAIPEQERIAMGTVYVLNCREAGLDCDFETLGANLDEVMRHCAEHATKVHGWKSFGPELYAKMRSCLKTIEAYATVP